MKTRLDNLRLFLQRRELDAVIVTKRANVTHFSGFAGTAGILVVTGQKAKLITDFRYMEQAEQQAPLFERVKCARDIFAETAATVAALRPKRIGFEGNSLTYNHARNLQKLLKKYKLKPVGLDGLRVIKDAAALARVRKAVAIADAAFSHILTVIKPGVAELEIAAELEYAMRKQGAQKPSFDTIVAAGVRGAMPHAQPSAKRIAAGEFVTMDFGAVYEGYCSDMTRTVCVGAASGEQKDLYRLVLKAQLAGLRAVKPGLAGKAVDAAARRVIEDAGYGARFGHGLGHGVGLEIHEEPRLSPASGTDSLAENMLVTVEPGVYLPGWGGVRIEDLTVVSKDGCEVLTQSSKDLLEI